MSILHKTLFILFYLIMDIRNQYSSVVYIRCINIFTHLVYTYPTCQRTVYLLVSFRIRFLSSSRRRGWRRAWKTKWRDTSRPISYCARPRKTRMGKQLWLSSLCALPKLIALAPTPNAYPLNSLNCFVVYWRWSLGFIAKNIKLSLFDRFTRVYKSETKAHTPNPEWSAFTRSCVELCNGQKDRKMKITVFDDRKGKWVQMLANPAQLGNFKILPHIIYSNPHPTLNRLTKCCNSPLVRQYICATSALHLYVGTRPVSIYLYIHT